MGRKRKKLWSTFFLNKAGHKSPILIKKKDETNQDFFARMEKAGWSNLSQGETHWTTGSPVEYHVGSKATCSRCNKAIVPSVNALAHKEQPPIAVKAESKDSTKGEETPNPPVQLSEPVMNTQPQKDELKDKTANKNEPDAGKVPSLCKFFEHIKHDDQHIHKCKKRSNTSHMCGYKPETLTKCPDFKPGKDFKPDDKDGGLKASGFVKEEKKSFKIIGEPYTSKV